MVFFFSPFGGHKKTRFAGKRACWRLLPSFTIQLVRHGAHFQLTGRAPHRATSVYHTFKFLSSFFFFGVFVSVNCVRRWFYWVCGVFWGVLFALI